MKISVIGAGTWGTALAIVLARNLHEVYLWTKFPEEAEKLTLSRRHPNLPGSFLPDSVGIGTDLAEALRAREMLVMAVPSIYVRETARLIRETGLMPSGASAAPAPKSAPLSSASDPAFPVPAVAPETPVLPQAPAAPIIVSVAKGIEEGSFLTLSEVIEEELPGIPVAVLSGPSHAEEVSRFLPATVVVGSRSREAALRVQDAFMNEFFRVYYNPDWRGIEIGAALKNVVALAAGVSDGLHYGDNAKAALITRGIVEISRLGVAMGCEPVTFAGLSGIGDLIVTCASVHSRNRMAGVLIGAGKSYEEAMREVGQTVEGVYAAKAAKALSERYHVVMPIVEKVNEVLFEGKDPKTAVLELMQRDKRDENWT